jgi:hypothetical protein
LATSGCVIPNGGGRMFIAGSVISLLTELRAQKNYIV